MTEDKRQRILDAAFDLFKKYGFMKTTVDEIAQNAKVGKGTIYSYFKNKEDILVLLTDREMAKGFAMVANALKKELNARDKLKTLLRVTFEFFHSNELVSKILAMDQGLVLSIIEKKNREYQDTSMKVLKFLLEQGRNEGSFREMDYEKAAYIMDSLIRSFHYLHYLGLDIYSPNEIITPCIDLIFLGLEKG